MKALQFEIKGLKTAYNKSMSSFNKNVDRQLEVHESMLVVHKGIMGIVQVMSLNIVESTQFIK